MRHLPIVLCTTALLTALAVALRPGATLEPAATRAPTVARLSATSPPGRSDSGHRSRVELPTDPDGGPPDVATPAPASHDAFDVDIVDSNGNPCPGVPLALEPWPLEPGPPPLGPTRADVVSDANGRAHVAGLAAFVSRHERGGRAVARAVLRFAFPIRDAWPLEFDPRDPPTEAAVIVLPPTGVVVVDFVDIDGSPIDGATDISLRRVEGGDAAPLWSGRATRTGVARFDHVGVGEVLDVTTCFAYRTVPQRFVGPQRAGEITKITLHVTPDTPLLRGAVVDDCGRPLADATLSIHGHGPGFPRRFALRAKTDRDGAFRFEFAPGMSGEPVTIDAVTTVLTPDTGVSLATTEFAFIVAPGSAHLGRLVLRPAWLLVDGRVTIDGEIPDASARLAFDVEDAATMQALPGAFVSIEADGRFTVHGPRQDGALRLCVTDPDCVAAAPRSIEPGTHDVPFELVRGGSLRCDVVADAASVDTLRFRLCRDGVPVGAPRADAPTSRRWRGLAPGVYTLTIDAPGRADPIATLHDLVVCAGSACDDPRLRAIDVRRE